MYKIVLRNLILINIPFKNGMNTLEHFMYRFNELALGAKRILANLKYGWNIIGIEATESMIQKYQKKSRISS